ncbi:MAG: 3-hydroxyacyl-ACP dehydratase FabZ [Spirochaetaceae bacterium]|jgi:3-hydroxyacyl-[acyl-carrier-protein] dehydratase|nr:3-hydroxyacyl-ACP dehydratase FabZ [Spirochaetaceae bacterium]
MDNTEIAALLPHREPFLFVNEILKADKEGISARYVFTEDAFFFRGHFPQYPVVPGVILIETMAQSGGAGLCKLGMVGTESDTLFFLAAVDKVKFRRQVRPGETVRSEIVNLRVSTSSIKQAGKAYVGDELAAEAEWLCLIRRNNGTKTPDPQ